MLAAKDFAARWDNETLIRFSTETVQRLAMPEDDKAFLIQAGLPEEAAPFLMFARPDSGELPTAAEQWGLAKEFARYRVIGGDGAGNPIALDETQQGQVVYLDHENGFARVYMNASIRQMAESLLAYRKLIKDTQAEFGPDAFLDGKIPAAARANLKGELTRIDAAAMKPGCFWHTELQNLDANAT